MDSVHSISAKNFLIYNMQVGVENIKLAWQDKDSSLIARICRAVLGAVEFLALPGLGTLLAVADAKWFFKDRVQEQPKDEPAPKEGFNWKRAGTCAMIALMVVIPGFAFAYNFLGNGPDLPPGGGSGSNGTLPLNNTVSANDTLPLLNVTLPLNDTISVNETLPLLEAGSANETLPLLNVTLPLNDTVSVNETLPLLEAGSDALNVTTV